MGFTIKFSKLFGLIKKRFYRQLTWRNVTRAIITIVILRIVASFVMPYFAEIFGPILGGVVFSISFFFVKYLLCIIGGGIIEYYNGPEGSTNPGESSKERK